MNVTGKVVSVEQNVEITKQDGGVYQGTRFSYRDSAGKLQEQNFHNNTFKFNPKIKVALANLNPGDDFTMVKEKKGEFWNVVDILSGGAVTTSQPSANKPTATASPKSNYETPDERAARQVMIVRQSSLSTAVAALKNEKNTVSAKDAITYAKELEAYVMGIEFDDGSIMSLPNDDLEIQ